MQHLLAFLTITLLADACSPETGLNWKKILLVFSYGLLIEILQSMTNYRTASLADLITDAGGILLYWLITPILQKTPVIQLRWGSHHKG